MLQAGEAVIEEYEPRKHAKSIAEMWNRSFESWGGDNAYLTEQSVIDEHRNSTHLKLFLAVVAEEVIGYCSFSHYKEDTGALYIPLLNVRPDYHGRKIGKMLVRRALEETIKLGWPRLDLYTWPGNTKAVPTYKKSGFFWEKRDDSTHLMNFIPSVLQTGAVKHYFETIDWYKDSTRDISVQPDGRKENGFDYFTYTWSKDSLQLKMEYERSGRGLRLIETEDYLITATIPRQHKLPFGNSYPIVYEAVNKSGQPLTLQVKSISNPQIRFELNESRVIAATESIEGSFYIHPVEEEQNAYQTHPVVEAELLINGLPVVFKLGVEPKFPVKLKLELPNRDIFAGEDIELDLTVLNEYDTEMVFSLDLPSDSILAFNKPDVTVAVPPKGRRTVPLAAKVLAYGLWHHSLNITASGESRESSVIQQELSLVFPGLHTAFGGQTDMGWMISNGSYAAHLNKFSNALTLHEGRHRAFKLFHPKFGLPYTNEFNKNPVLQMVHYREEEAMVLEAQYALDFSDGLLLTLVVKLYSSGIFTRHFRIHNTSSVDRNEEIYLKDSFSFGLDGGVMPYRGEYIDLHQGVHASSLDYWEADELTENWLFADDGKTTRGITWPSELKLIRDHWMYAVEHQLKEIPAGSILQTKPLRVALGTWSSWRDFRSFALLQGDSQDLNTSPQLKVIFSDGNPFISGSPVVRLQEHKKIFLDGRIGVSSLLNSIEEHSHDVNAEQKLTEVNLPLLSKEGAEADLVSVQLDWDIYEMDKSYLIFPGSVNEMIQETRYVEQAEVLIADNGVLKIQASSSFAPALFSLQYHGEEWLDSSFPHPAPKSWWNPWMGGLSAGFDGISPLSLIEEPREAAFAQMSDNKGNLWSGIRMSVTITNNPKFRGLTLHHYFLLLPGAPVLASTVRIEQHTGSPLYPLELISSGYYKTGSELMDSRGRVKNASGENIIYKAGRVQCELNSPSGIIQYSSRERKQKLTLIANPELDATELLVNTHVIASYTTEKLYLRDGIGQFSKPQFHLISDLQIPEQAYEDLLTIKFMK
ncbi:GNAT family N-acetyltransferase [Paenibacillus ihuae]|uniref:GNAT family N-acetyltransferase n=1 Tax=Paenibacillus ihuae TaxID=1232431 RepID=UPI0006D5572E|nr:GNAT family N-acetyltransferase [Paenibacillus ihuae]